MIDIRSSYTQPLHSKDKNQVNRKVIQGVYLYGMSFGVLFHTYVHLKCSFTKVSFIRKSSLFQRSGRFLPIKQSCRAWFKPFKFPSCISEMVSETQASFLIQYSVQMCFLRASEGLTTPSLSKHWFSGHRVCQTCSATHTHTHTHP